MAGGVAYCGKCGAPNAPGTRFCGNCGNALPVGPVAAAVPVAAYAGAPAAPPYAYQPAPGYAAGARGKTSVGLWLLVAGGVGFFIVCLGVIAVLLAGHAPLTAPCPPTCQPPPKQLAPPLGPQHAFTSTKYGWSLAYPDQVAGVNLTVASQSDTGIHFTAHSFPVAFESEPANGRGPDAIAEALHQKQLPQATFVYALPAAEMGYNPGYGAVYDATVNASNGQALHVRMIIVVAVKKDVAVELVEIGPFIQTTPKDGFPNPAD
ncbi:MAG TPA: zinc ribbon domain-containing protein, partial [Candidatus Dormibacteraeota bacterium]